MKRNHWLYLIATLCGAAIWVVVALVSGRKEAWDSDLYFSVGVPVLCIISMALAFIERERPWRWGVLSAVGQFSAMLLWQGPGNLLPLGVVMFGVLSLPTIFTAQLGAFIATRWARRRET